jgi:hypothetical protein
MVVSIGFAIMFVLNNMMNVLCKSFPNSYVICIREGLAINKALKIEIKGAHVPRCYAL